MSFSLANREDTLNFGALEIGAQADLSVDRAVAAFCPDRRRADYSWKLSRPLQSVETLFTGSR